MPNNQNQPSNPSQEKSQQGLSAEQRRRHGEQTSGEQGKSSGSSTDRNTSTGSRQGNQSQRSPMEDQDDLDRARDDEKDDENTRIEGKSIPGRQKGQTGSAMNDEE